MAADPPAIKFGDRPQLSDQVAQHVRDLIFTGQLPPGAPVRQERIAEEIGLSATPIREGLMALRAEGFVKLIPRRGFVVAPLDSNDIIDIFEAQALLSGEMAARAALRMNKADRQRLVTIHKAMSDAADAGDAERVDELNHDFHRTISTAAAAPKMAWMLSIAARYAPRRFFAGVEGWPAASTRDHALILMSLLAEDAQATREAMQAHIRNAGRVLAEHFDRMLAQARTSPTRGAAESA